MSKPRITVSVIKDENGEPAQVYFYLNHEGRALLVDELSKLSETSDHFHMHPADWQMEVPLSMRPYSPDQETLPTHVKMMFRPDEWDKAHFPHVMAD